MRAGGAVDQRASVPSPVDVDADAEAAEAVDHGLGVVGARARRSACWTRRRARRTTRARLVMLLEPGTATTASSGRRRAGSIARRVGSHGRDSSAQPADGRTEAPGDQPAPEQVALRWPRSAGSARPVALGRVVHLEVGHVDAQLGRQREHLGGGARPVGDR